MKVIIKTLMNHKFPARLHKIWPPSACNQWFATPFFTRGSQNYITVQTFRFKMIQLYQKQSV